MDDKNVYLNEDNAIFMEGLCKYYKTTDLSFWLDDVEDLPIDLFENGFMEEKFVEKYRSGYSNYKNLLNHLDINSSECYDYYYVAIFTIFKAYIHNKNDFDSFSNIVDDVLSSEINSARFLKGIDIIVRCTNYKEMTNIRRLMKMMLKSYVDLIYLLSPSKELYDSFLAIYKQMIDDYTELGEKCDIDAFNKVLDFRVGELLKKYGSYESLYVPRKEKRLIEVYYYDKALLKGNRYFYFNEKLREVEDRIYFRYTISSYLEHVNFKLFEELNEEKGKDSFISCIDMVFDSDSYQELFSKLDSIVTASIKYESGDFTEAFDIINELNSDKHKEVYCGEMVSYPTNTMNLISKPKRIIDRMKYLYNRIDSSISYDFMDDIYSDCDTVSNLISSINAHIKKEKSPFKKLIKSFIKRK